MVIEGKSVAPYYQNITNKDDLVQNMANHWREGKGRNKRMDEEKAKAEAEGEKYVVSHGYEDIESTPISMRGVHIHNRAIIRKALGRPD